MARWSATTRHSSWKKALIAMPLICVLYILFRLFPSSSEPRMPPLPTYKEVHEYERNLPQHNLELPFPEGKTGKYVLFSNQIGMLGWNNVLNEILLCTHLAWRSKRAYVFQDYHWKPEYYPWKVRNQRSVFTPLNALIAGPTAGGPWSTNDKAPRSVSKAWFYKVCPQEDIAVIDAPSAKDPVRWHSAKEVMDHFVKLFENTPQRCIIVDPGTGDGFPQTFDLWTVSTPLILPLWDEFKNSPVSRLLRTPPLVNAAIKTNEHLFFPERTLSFTTRYQGMMAVHIRRGDYEGACQGLADWNSTFYMWNLLPGLPDPLFAEGPIGEPVPGKNTPNNYAMVKKRCFPTEEELVAKIMESKLDWETGRHSNGVELTTLYIMTNAKKDWLNKFRKRMLEEGWTTVATSKDLKLNSDQTAVSMAVDMDIGRRAAVLIGNGWSSMTSNIVHRRLIDGHHETSVRFW